MGLEAVEAGRRTAVVADRHGQEVVLQVRVLHTGLAADKTARFKMVGRPQARALEHPLQADLHLGQRVHRAVERDGLFAGVLHIGFQVVLQVLTYAAQRGHHADAQPAQGIGVANAGELQQLRRVDGTAAQNHLAAGLDVVGAVAVDHLHPRGLGRAGVGRKAHTRHQCAGAHLQVGAREGRAQVGHGGAPAAALVHRHVHGAQAFLAVAVHVFGARITGLLAGFNEGVVERVFAGAGGHMQGPTVAPVVVPALGPCFGLAEVGQAVGIRPVLQSGVRRPALVVHGVAADVDHAVDRGRAAQHPPARAVHGAVVHEGLGLGVVVPVVLVVGQRVGKGRWHVDEDAFVAGAGFEQQHRHLGVLGQAVGQHTAGRTGAHDDVVKSFCAHGKAWRRVSGSRRPPGRVRRRPF